MKRDTILNQVTLLLQEAGAIYHVEKKNHVKVYWERNGFKRIIVFPNTPSDPRSVKNAIAFVKRQLRETGYGI